MDLSATEEDILLSLLISGPGAPSEISGDIDRHPKSVSRALSSLEDQDFVRSRGAGTWRLTPAGIALAREVARDRSIW